MATKNASAESGIVPSLVTIKNARTITGLGNTTVWQLIHAGELQSLKIGRRRMIVLASIHDLITRRLAEQSRKVA